MTAKPVAAALVTSEDKRYGVRKQWPLSGAEVELSYLAPDRSSRWIDRRITLHGELDDQQRMKLAEIAEKTPGHEGGAGRDRDPHRGRPRVIGRVG